MKNSFTELYTKFIEIKRRGWIAAQRNGSTAIGYTFESLLNINENCSQAPDFLGIEIKTMRYFSKRKIHLINITPDGNKSEPIKRIIKMLGYPDKCFPAYKVFYATANAKEYTRIGYKLIKIKVDYDEKKIKLLAYSIYDRFLDVDISWSFDLLEKVISKKLTFLAIVKASTKTIKNTEYFFYHTITFYQLKNFKTFLRLIEDGIIEINFKIDIYKYGNKIGKTHDKGIDFSIYEKDIELLYNKISIK